ncbi:hypothetical protein KF840_22395 [bacterium]|nr:hypothetical protein [bacterium]
MIDRRALQQAAAEIATTRTAMIAARDALQIERAAMDAPDIVAAYQADYRAGRKAQARRDAVRRARPLADAALSRAQALQAERAALSDPYLAALRARPVPAVKPFNRHELVDGLADFQVDAARQHHEQRQQAAELANTLTQFTALQRVSRASARTLTHLVEQAAADRNLWLLGVLADELDGRAGKAYAPVRRRVHEAITATPLPADQAEVLEVLDAIAADAETIRQVYGQMATGDVDDVGAVTTAEKPSGPALEAEGPGSGIRHAQERLERRAQRRREAAVRAREELERAPQPEPTAAVPAA